MALKPLPVRVFTRADPCTKVDLHNCFISPGGSYLMRPVVEARGIIGLNAIKYLIREGYARTVHDVGIEYWQLTAAGRTWLSEGLQRHLELHPDDAKRVRGRIPTPARKRRVQGL